MFCELGGIIMEIPKKFIDMVSTDVQRVENLSECEDTDYLLSLHRELDGKYQACVKDWYKGIWGVDKNATNIWYAHIEDSRTALLDNLRSFKSKLQTFIFQMNVNTMPSIPSTHVNVTTNVNLNVTFQQVRAQVEDMTSLTDEQTQEILDKITEIEAAYKENGSKKSKWEKVKPVLVWLADKSFDVGMTLLPLLLKIQQ